MPNFYPKQTDHPIWNNQGANRGQPEFYPKQKGRAFSGGEDCAPERNRGAVERRDGAGGKR
jgi:hypothetical protein